MIKLKLAKQKSRHAVLVGGAGLIGKHLTLALVNRDWTVSVVTAHPHRHRNLLVMPKLRMVGKQTLESDEDIPLFNDADVVFNLIPCEPSSAKIESDSYVQFTEQIVNLCLENNAKRLIHVSALGADLSANEKFLRTKAEAEIKVLNSITQGLDCTIIRPAIVLGSGNIFTRHFTGNFSLLARFLASAYNKASIQPVYIDDLINCILHVINHPDPINGCFEVVGPNTYTLRQIIALIEEMNGSSPLVLTSNKILSRLVIKFSNWPFNRDWVEYLEAVTEIDINQPQPFGIQPTALTPIAKNWAKINVDPMDAYRIQARR